MSVLQPNMSERLVIASANQQSYDITDSVTSISFNYTLDAGTELSLGLADQGRRMLLNSYFRMGQLFFYGNAPYQLASIDISQGEGDTANVTLQMLDYKFQQLKQDFTPQAFRAANGFLYAELVARQYNLKFVGKNVKGKQQTIKVKTKNNRESVWDVLQRSAADNQYMCFIADNTLFFAPPKDLLGRWGIDTIQYQPKGETKPRPFRYVPLVYPTPDSEKRFFLTEIPRLRRSIDSRKEAEGSATILGPAARNLRAGMTVMLYGMEQFNQAYLITSVDYDERSTEPVSINFANISALAPEDKAKIDEKISEVTVISGSGG